jgi:hypothetical protein
VKVVGVGTGDQSSGIEFRDATGTTTPTMVVDESYALWAHYNILSNSEAVLLNSAGAEIARFDQYDTSEVTAALP